MSEDRNAELWKDITEKSYDPSKLPEVEYEYDEGAEVDLRAELFKKTDAQRTSPTNKRRRISASSSYTERDYDWKRVAESKKKIFLINSSP